jgi:dolichol-phosphate mannosyltransferase
MKLSIVVPVYNEEVNLPTLAERVAATFAGRDVDWELILVNDNSRDNSWKIIGELNARDGRVVGVALSRNFGQQPAIAAGLAVAVGDVAAVMDADLQDPPELLLDMLAKIGEGYDVVYAMKRSRGEKLLRRTVFNLFYTIQTRLAEPKMVVGAGTFCMMTRRVIEVLNRMREHSRYLSGLRTYVGFKQTGVEFDRPDRMKGAPQQTFSKLMRTGMDAIFAYSYVPVRLASWLGMITVVFALLAAGWVLYQRLVTHTAITGWTSTMVSYLFIGAVQLICLGILGEYVARIYEEVRHRPLFIVAETVGLEAEQAKEGEAPPPQ